MTPKHDLEFANQKQERNTFQEEDSLCTQVGRSRGSRGVCESNLILKSQVQQAETNAVGGSLLGARRLRCETLEHSTKCTSDEELMEKQTPTRSNRKHL